MIEAGDENDRSGLTESILVLLLGTAVALYNTTAQQHHSNVLYNFAVKVQHF